jgi:hypothetical protein
VLCCGFLTFVVACAVALWRRLRALPGLLLALGWTILLATPALALTLSCHVREPDQDNSFRQALRAFCGAPMR